MARWIEIAGRHRIPLETLASDQVSKWCADPLRNQVNATLVGMDHTDR